MTAAFRRALPLIVLGASLSAAATADEPLVPDARVDFLVLTPALQGGYFMAAAADLTAFVPPYLALGKLGSGGRATQLRALVERESYDPTRAIADRLIEALAAESYRAVYEPIPRKPAGSLQSLSWGDLPEAPKGEMVLDLVVHWICLCADVAFSKHYPAISVSWRLLDPKQRVVMVPSRTLTYYHFPAWYYENKSRADKARGATPSSPYPVETVSDSCGFQSAKAASENPAVLWGCLGEGYAAAARRLAIDVKRLRPPRESATASSGTPSGTSTR